MANPTSASPSPIAVVLLTILRRPSSSPTTPGETRGGGAGPSPTSAVPSPRRDPVASPSEQQRRHPRPPYPTVPPPASQSSGGPPRPSPPAATRPALSCDGAAPAYPTSRGACLPTPLPFTAGTTTSWSASLAVRRAPSPSGPARPSVPWRDPGPSLDVPWLRCTASARPLRPLRPAAARPGASPSSGGPRAPGRAWGRRRRLGSRGSPSPTTTARAPSTARLVPRPQRIRPPRSGGPSTRTATAGTMAVRGSSGQGSSPLHASSVSITPW